MRNSRAPSKAAPHMGGLLCIHPDFALVQIQNCHAHIIELAQMFGLAFDLICHAPPAGSVLFTQRTSRSSLYGIPPCVKQRHSSNTMYSELLCSKKTSVAHQVSRQMQVMGDWVTIPFLQYYDSWSVCRTPNVCRYPV